MPGCRCSADWRHAHQLTCATPNTHCLVQDQSFTGEPSNRMSAFAATASLLLVTLFVNLLVLGADETAARLEGGRSPVG